MNRISQTFNRFILLFIAVLVAGCGSAEEFPVADNETLTDGFTLIKAEAGPVFLAPPEGYLLENGREGISLNRAGDAGTMLFGVQVTAPSGRSADVQIQDFMADLPNGWNRLIQDEEVGGLTGRGTRFSLETDSDEFLTGRVIALRSTGRDYLIFAIMDREDWITRGSADFSALLASISIDDDQSAEINVPESDTFDDTPILKPTPRPSIPVAIPPFAGQTADGYACAGGWSTGLMCIDPAGEWEHFTTENSDLQHDSIYDLAACPDGRLLIADVSVLTFFDGDTFTLFAQPESPGSVDSAACGHNGEIWLTHFRGLSVNRGDGWTFIEKEAIFQDPDTIINDIAVLPDGTVWAISFNEIVSLAPDDTEWTVYAEGSGLEKTFFFDQIRLDSAGKPIVLHSGGYLIFNDGVWRNAEIGSQSPGHFALAADDVAYITTFSDGLMIKDGETERLETVADGLSRNNTDLIEIDDRGRIWLTTEIGIDVRGIGGWSQLRMDNSDLPSNQINHFVVMGDGPAQVPNLVNQPHGSVTGQLLSPGGIPLSNADIVLCLSGYLSYSDPAGNPCDGQPETFTGQSDEAGQFTIENIPSAWYAFFFVYDGEWHERLDEDGIFGEDILVRSDELSNIGQVQAAEDDS